MPPPPYPQLSLSATQISLRERCPRRWWFRYVGHWNGWLSDASPESQEAYRLGKLESVATWTGKRIHDGISLLVRDPKATAGSVGRGIENKMRSEYRGSAGIATGRFGDPKALRLEEHYFGTALRDSQLDDCVSQLQIGLGAFERFCNAEPTLNFRAMVQSARENMRFIHVDHEAIPMEARGFHSSDIASGEVTVYSAPDFVVETEDGRLIVIDWKTGDRWGPSENELTSQLESYAAWLWIQHRPVVRRAKSVELYEFHLPTCKPAGRPATTDDFERAASRVRDEANRLLGLRGSEPAVRREACPPKPHPDGCKWCPFRGLCREGAACLSADIG
jgi:hypothetical protein